MVLVLRALLFIGGLFFVMIGIGFLFDPVGSGAGFGLTSDGAQGLATMRADMTAFFVVAGGCMIWGGWARKGDPLLVSAALMAIAIIGRIVGLVQDGAWDGFWSPMVVEAIVLTLSLIASRVLPHTALTGDN